MTRSIPGRGGYEDMAPVEVFIGGAALGLAGSGVSRLTV